MNACILLSTATGSTMLKSKDRLLGMVVGTVFGQLSYALLAWCTLWAYCAVMGSVMLWLSITLYVYFNSVQYSVVGCLLAAFGTPFLLMGCSDGVYDPRVGYPKIIDTIITVIVMVLVENVVDLLRQEPRASDKAAGIIPEIMMAQKEALGNLFDPNVVNTRFHKGAILDLLSSASALGEHAEAEPRYGRRTWPNVLFIQAVEVLSKLRVYLSCMEYAAAENAQNGGPKAEFLMIASKDVDFLKAKSIVDERMVQFNQFLQIFSFDSSEQVKALDKAAEEQKNFSALMKTTLDDFMNKLKTTTTASSSELQVLAKEQVPMCLFISGLLNVMRELRELEHDVLRAY